MVTIENTTKKNATSSKNSKAILHEWERDKIISSQGR